jgi:hypothetical protein
MDNGAGAEIASAGARRVMRVNFMATVVLEFLRGVRSTDDSEGEGGGWGIRMKSSRSQHSLTYIDTDEERTKTSQHTTVSSIQDNFPTSRSRSQPSQP